MKIDNIEFDGIDHADHPDYTDAYIVSCDIDGIPATEQQLEDLNDDRDFVHTKLWEWLY